MPGEEVIELPAGEARLSYRVFIDRSGESIKKLDLPDALAISAEPAGGGEAASVERVTTGTRFRSLRRRAVQTHFANLHLPATASARTGSPRATRTLRC